MINIDQETLIVLQNMAQRLKEARLARNESQELFATRLGISRQTYSKMEKGVTSVAIGYWLMACSILNSLDSWKTILVPEDDLFAQYERQQHGRQRAGKSRTRL